MQKETDDRSLRECIVTSGTWMRYVGPDKGTKGQNKEYELHRFNDDTRVVHNVTQEEFNARRFQLQPVGGSFAIERLFSPEKVMNSSVPNAKGMIALATSDDLHELERIAKRDTRRGLRRFYQDQLARLGSDVNLPPLR